MIGYGLWGMGVGLKTMQRYEKKSGYAIVCPESCESCPNVEKIDYRKRLKVKSIGFVNVHRVRAICTYKKAFNSRDKNKSRLNTAGN